MWLCSSCGLAQLLTDPTVPEEPRGAEPAALVAQAADAVARAGAAGLLPAGSQVVEYGSPHGGSWLGELARCGLTPASAIVARSRACRGKGNRRVNFGRIADASKKALDDREDSGHQLSPS